MQVCRHLGQEERTNASLGSEEGTSLSPRTHHLLSPHPLLPPRPSSFLFTQDADPARVLSCLFGTCLCLWRCRKTESLVNCNLLLASSSVSLEESQLRTQAGPGENSTSCLHQRHMLTRKRHCAPGLGRSFRKDPLTLPVLP